jgi:hypothetical protein
MDDKTITAVSTSLALMQLQVNALLLLLEQQHPSIPLRAEFQRLISEGVETVGVETMEGIKSRILQGIIQQGQGENGNGNDHR